MGGGSAAGGRASKESVDYRKGTPADASCPARRALRRSVAQAVALFVTPAKAGAHSVSECFAWVPAFAAMTLFFRRRLGDEPDAVQPRLLHHADQFGDAAVGHAAVGAQ